MASDAAAPAPAQPAPPKRRGSYNCGRCGLPKKGHVCSVPRPASSAIAGGGDKAGQPRRALQFDDPAALAVVLDAVPLAVSAPPPQAGSNKAVDVEEEDGDGDNDPPAERWVEVGAGRRAPGEVLVEVLRRLSPRAVAAAAGVSRGWHECARRVWRAAEEVRLRAAGVRPVGALMARCPALARLVLRMDW